MIPKGFHRSQKRVKKRIVGTRTPIKACATLLGVEAEASPDEG